MPARELAWSVHGAEIASVQQVKQHRDQHQRYQRSKHVRRDARGGDGTGDRGGQNRHGQRQQGAPRNDHFAGVADDGTGGAEQACELAGTEQKRRRHLRVDAEECRKLYQTTAAHHGIDETGTEGSRQNQ
jgi:hypothetical protein